MRYRVHMQSRPAVGRTFYDGHIVVNGIHEGQAVDEAVAKASRLYGHRDWRVTRVEVISS